MSHDLLRQTEAFEQLERLDDAEEALDLELLPDGRLRAQKAAAREILRDRLRSAEVLPTGPGWSVLRSRGPAAPRELLGRAREVVAAGVLGGPGWPIVDVVGFVASGTHTGVLTVGDEVKRSVFFFQGDVVWASSTSPLERLGTFLLARGKITRDQLHAALRDGPSGMGRACVERGYLGPDELEPLVERYVAERFEFLLAAERGLWSFARMADEPLAGAPLRLPTNGLLVDGLRRQDEMRIYRQRIRSADAMIRRGARLGGAEPAEEIRHALALESAVLPEDSASVLRALPGAATVQELMRRTGQGEFEVTRAVYQLLRANLVTIVPSTRRESRPTLLAVDAREVVHIHGLALAEIMAEVARAGRVEEMLEAANAFLEVEGGVHRDLLADLRLDSSGRLDDQTLLARHAAAAGSPDTLSDALGELLFFALARASQLLGRRRGDDLARRVRLIHGMLRRPESR